MVEYLNAYIFFIEWKAVSFFWSHPVIEPGPWQNTLCEKGNFSSYLGEKIWEIVPSIWLCIRSLPHIFGKFSLNFLSVW